MSICVCVCVFVRVCGAFTKTSGPHIIEAFNSTNEQHVRLDIEPLPAATLSLYSFRVSRAF